MKKVGLTQNHRTEKVIIDALLKISEIVQKTEANRQHQKSINTKKTLNDGDYNELHDDKQPQQVPVPPPMCTLDSYISDFNQQSLQRPSNCNQASIHRPKQYVLNPSWNSQENNEGDEQSLDKQCPVSNDYENQERSYKRHYYDTLSTSSSNDHYHRKKSLKHHSSHRSFRSNKNSQPICQESENQPTITTFNSQTTSYQINSAATIDDQSSSLIMMPITSVPTISPSIIVEQQSSINSIPLHIEQQQQISSPSKILTNSKTNFHTFIDQQLQETLEKYLKNHLLSSTITNHENIQQQKKIKVPTLTKSETGKLLNELNFTKQVCNLEHYEKQRELAMLAVKQGNYSLSYSIYTNLLHDKQYDYKLKSEILASRAITLLLEQKCFESINDCTQAIAFNQWNKLAYIVRAACWMIKQEYLKAVEDYSKLFHFFDQTQHVLDLLNLAYKKFKILNNDDQLIKIVQEKENIQLIKDSKNENNITSSIDTHINPTQSFSLVSPTASFIQPTIYLCYPYQTWYSTNEEKIQQSNDIMNPISPIERKSSFSMNKKSQSNLIWIKNPYRSF